MFEELAEYYREGGLFECRQSRMERYEILYRFAKEKDNGEFTDTLACFAQCLLYDFYCREKPKSQPGFAREMDCEKRQRKEVFAEFGVAREESGQYYVACFNYDMDAAREGRTIRKRGYFLFDYTSRDPLSGACVIHYKEENTNAARCLLRGRDGRN